MKVFTCTEPKKLLYSPKVQKLAKCVEIKVVKSYGKPKYDCFKPYPSDSSPA